MASIVSQMTHSCTTCGGHFEITDADLAFHDKVSPVFAGRKELIPPPTLCPQCRLRRKLIWRAELHLFKRKSDFSGEEILSYFPETADCKVYSPREWWSDAWNPLDYGRSFDFLRTFTEQFADLLRTVPLISLSWQSNENCDYINNAGWNRNCYLLAGANHNEDCHYGNFVNDCRNCMDCSFADRCELCYECIDCTQCYDLRFSQNCSHCSESSFLFSCRGCRHCFGSVNLVEREYVFFNEQLTKEAYEERLREVGLDRRSRTEEAQTFFDQHRLKFPCKEMIGEMNEDVSGNVILRSRRAHDCFDVSDLEDCKHCSWFHQAKDCRDCYAWGLPAEECYECMEVGDRSRRALFSVVGYGLSDSFYCFNCMHSSNLFGCVSLRHKQYCIFNTQYSKEEYEELVPKIIEHMRKTPLRSPTGSFAGQAGEWGEFLPMSLSPLAYNQTIAIDYFPLRKEEALRLGAKWNDAPPPEQPLHREDVPDSMHDADESICGKTLTCSETGKSCQVIKQEFRFLKKQGIPIPAKHWYARHTARLRKRNPRRLWDRICAKCSKPIHTSYAPDRPEIVYCEQCYLAALY